MRRGLRFLWRRHRIALLAFVAASSVMLFFLTRLIVSTVYWSDPAHRDQRLEGWMTPRYVARSWGLAPDALREGLGLAPQGGPVTLEQIAASRGVPLAQVLDEVWALIEAARRAPPPAAGP
ncbi:MAG: hypothetical protein ACOY5U_04580 [Pseudomonadota bacterium]